MKRKRFGAYRWSSILKKRYKQKELNFEEFKGIAGLLYIDECTDYTSWDIKGEPVEVGGRGMKWLQLMPEDKKYVVTAMISREGKINLFYIDMIADGGLDEEDGIAWFDDLYLDLIVHPDGIFHIDDREELDEAYEQKIITKQQYEMAIATCDRLQRILKQKLPEFMEFCYCCVKVMEEVPEFTPLPEKIY